MTTEETSFTTICNDDSADVQELMDFLEFAVQLAPLKGMLKDNLKFRRDLTKLLAKRDKREICSELSGLF